MNRALQKSWNQLQMAYSAYCLPSIHSNDNSRRDALNAIQKAMQDCSCYVPIEYVELKPVWGI